MVQFHHRNLKNKDFRGQNLTGSDFSYADIRGANFTNAILVGANFSNAKAGISLGWAIRITIFLLFLSLGAGLVLGYAGGFISDLLRSPKYGAFSIGTIALITLIIFLIVIFCWGLGTTFATLAMGVAACPIAALALLPNEAAKSLTEGAVLTALALEGAIAGIGIMAVALAVAKIMSFPQARVINGLIGVIGIAIGVLLGVRDEEEALWLIIFTCLIAALIGLVLMASGIYIGCCAIRGDKKYALVRAISIGIVAQGGTSFRGTNLTDADFTEATLKSVDFRNAVMTRTCWFGAEKLDQARVNGTYLQEARVRELAITKDGRDQNYDRLNLRGLNLKNANLQDASFISTDLSTATLENANLFNAKLVQAQLFQTNLNAACLTGTYIQNWGISTDTQLEGVKCEYIYMQLPTKDDPDPCRKPDNRKETFKSGDFADFIAPIIKTLDLYQKQNIDPRQITSKLKTLDLFHYEGIDPTAAAIAITQLADNYPEAELEVVALEGRGQEKIRLQAVVAGDVNRSELYHEYFKTYGQLKSLPYGDLQTLLLGVKEKDERIRSLENLLENAIHQPKFYVETYQTQGDFNMSQSNKGNVNISSTQGNISGVAAAGEDQTMTGVAIGAISGNVTNTINQLPDNAEETGIKELLTELQLAIEADTNLSNEDKEEALKQVQTIAEVGQKPQDQGMQKIVKNALKFLKGTIADLPSTVELVQTCGKVFPLVTQFFGF